MSKREKKAAMNLMEEEIREILNTTDYSNYEINIYYDEATDTTIVPKPVFALTFINSDVREWVFNIISQHPESVVRFE